MTEHDIEIAKSIADELEIYRHPEPLCVRAAKIMQVMIKYIEENQFLEEKNE